MDDPADFVLFGSDHGHGNVDTRRRKTIQDVVYDAGPARSTIRGGIVVNLSFLVRQMPLALSHQSSTLWAADA